VAHTVYMEEQSKGGRPPIPDETRDKVIAHLLAKDRIKPQDIARVTKVSLAYVYQVRGELKRSGKLES